MPRFVHFLYLIPLSLGALVSVRTFKHTWPQAFRYFSFFLWGTLLMEFFAIAWKLWLHDLGNWTYSKSNSWIYNLYYLPEYVFYIFFYSITLEYSKVRNRILFSMAVLFLVISIVNLLFFQGLSQLNTYTIIAGNMCVLYCALAYFRQGLQKVVSVKPVNDPLFWISVGAFIFHSATLPFFIFINYLNSVNLSLAIALFNIVLLLNIAMHTFYLIAFLCPTQYRKKPSLQY